MRWKTCKSGKMAIKVDLDKAYDRLNLSFIYDTFLKAIPSDSVQINMECITNVQMNCL